MREVEPHAFPVVEGMLAVDVQGFVREPSRLSGSPGPPIDLTNLIWRSSVVKASSAEVERLTPATQEALEQTVVLVTEGERGALVRNRGRETFVEARPVQVRHAIGAGDSYLAAFVYGMLLGASPEEAGERAARFTEAILRERLDTEQAAR
jgi:sugar/nucleoside kinase (ribokinase family)